MPEMPEPENNETGTLCSQQVNRRTPYALNSTSSSVSWRSLTCSADVLTVAQAVNKLLNCATLNMGPYTIHRE